MTGGAQGGAKRGLIGFLFAAIALLMQANAPVARAAVAAPIGVICHDTGAGRGQRPTPPSPNADHCAACAVCCTAPATALPADGGVLPRPALTVGVAHSPEAFAHPVRGPPARAPVARGPPPALA